MRRGTTLLETLTVIGLIGVLTSLVVLPTRQLVDGIRVRDATGAFAAACAIARQAAIGRSATAVVLVDTAAARLTVVVAGDTIHRDGLSERLGVRLSATGTSVTYSAIGLGFGLSNIRLIARRGSAADTITVSRLGRTRR